MRAPISYLKSDVNSNICSCSRVEVSITKRTDLILAAWLKRVLVPSRQKRKERKSIMFHFSLFFNDWYTIKKKIVKKQVN